MTTQSTKLAPQWTAFATHDVAVNWSDHLEAHRAVMRLFARDLPGTGSDARSKASILYRLDPQPDGTTRVLVQSGAAPELLPPRAQSRRVPEPAWAVPSGTRVQFRLAVNAISRRTDKSGPRRREVTNVIPFNDVDEWISARLMAVLRDIDLVNHTRMVSRARRGSATGPPILHVDSVDGLAVVSDAQGLQELRVGGVGREKAYGCGLLTLLPL